MYYMYVKTWTVYILERVRGICTGCIWLLSLYKGHQTIMVSYIVSLWEEMYIE